MVKKRSIIIDSHQHFWESSALSSIIPAATEIDILGKEYKPEHLRGHLRKLCIDYTVFVQAYPQNFDNNKWMFEIANKTDFVAGVVAWADMQKPNEIASVINLMQQEPKFCGIRHIVEAEPNIDWIVQPRVLESFRELSKHKIAYDMLAKPRHLKNVIKLMETVGDLKIVIDHIAKPEIAKGGTPGWEENMKIIAQYPGIYCKLSGMITEADRKTWKPTDLEPYICKIIDMFGYDRVMFGSDWPVCLLAGEYEDVWEALCKILSGINDEQKEKVFGLNALNFYNLKL